MVREEINHLKFSYNNLFNYLEQIIKLSKLERDCLREYFRISYYPAKSYFVESGSKNRQIGFISKGSAIDFLSVDDKYIINNLYAENSFIYNVHDFVRNSIADSDIQFCEEAIVLELDYHLYESMKTTFPKIIAIIKNLEYDEWRFYKRRSVSLQSKNAKNRYEELILNGSGILDKFKMKDIAAYLGMEQETLCRLKIQLGK